MSKFKHTPGPWGWAHREVPNGNYSTQVYDASGKEIATIAWYPVRQNNITITSREANARLIAAAPVLLEALREALDCIRVYAPDYMHGMPRKHYVSQARAAIAKATGEES